MNKSGKISWPNCGDMTSKRRYAVHVVCVRSDEPLVLNFVFGGRFISHNSPELIRAENI